MSQPGPGIVTSAWSKQETAKWGLSLEETPPKKPQNGMIPKSSYSVRRGSKPRSEVDRLTSDNEANGCSPMLVELMTMRQLLEEQLEALMLGQRQLQAAVGGMCNEIASLRTTSMNPHEQKTPGRLSEVDKNGPLNEDTTVSGSSRDDPTGHTSGNTNNLNSHGKGDGWDWDYENESRRSVKSDATTVRCRTPDVEERPVTAKAYALSLAEQELQRILRVSSNVSQLERKRSDLQESRLGRRASKSRLAQRALQKADATSWEMVFDSVIGFVILCNALFLGMSMDSPNANTGGWLVVECIFGVTFWIELVVKLVMKGWREQYCKSDSLSNIFDACLISVDSVQLVFTLFFRSLSNQMNSAGPSASLFRVVRLIRLTRILRLLRSQVFKDLLAMIQGMMGGMSTLMWSVVLFLLFIYVVSLVFREGLGPDPKLGLSDDDEKNVQRYFNGVPRSMYTIFRCSFGDCSTEAGTPIFEHVSEKQGALWSMIFSAFLFIVAIGLFNVISAIFVQSTLDSAAEIAASKRRVKLDNEEHWATNILAFLKPLLLHCTWENLTEHDIHNLDNGEATLELIDAILATEIPRSVIDDVVREDKLAQKALNNLDIEQTDHRYLSDILDPDNGGTVTARELVDGLKRLRGDPRRSDIITVDLMVRAMQEKVDEIWIFLHHQQDGIDPDPEPSVRV